MDERDPDNLKLLHDAFGAGAIDGILPGDSFSIDGVEFVCKYVTGSTATRFYIVKTLPLVQRYRAMCERFAGGNIVELGIAEGGSTALIALVAHPRHLVAVDLEPRPLDALSEFAREHGFTDTLHAHYGIDQSDAAQLAAAVDGSLAGEPIDLVFDDCSHKYGPTRASFECLFPRLRPGGLFVIEDWNADHVFRDAVRGALADPSAPNHEAADGGAPPVTGAVAGRDRAETARAAHAPRDRARGRAVLDDRCDRQRDPRRVLDHGRAGSRPSWTRTASDSTITSSTTSGSSRSGAEPPRRHVGRRRAGSERDRHLLVRVGRRGEEPRLERVPVAGHLR